MIVAILIALLVSVVIYALLLGTRSTGNSDVMARLSQRTLDRPTFSVDAIIQRVFRDPRSLGPFPQSEGQSVVLVMYDPATISVLHKLCCPAAVLGAIGPIAIDAVNAVLRRWAETHIDQELGERTPLGRNGNSTTAIARIVFAGWIRTPCPQPLPSLVLNRLGSPVSTAVNCLAMKAAARLCTAVEQAAAIKRASFPAITASDPVPPPLSEAGRIIGDDGQPPELLTEQISTIIGLHRVSPSLGVVPPAVTSSAGVSRVNYTRYQEAA